MPEPSLANVAGLACQGKAVPGAASFTDGPETSIHIFIANKDGSPSTWNKHLPQSLSAKDIADLNAVLCIDTQVPDTETFDCGSYRAVNTVTTVPLKVGRYLLHTRLVSAGTGETIFDYQVQGQRAECPQNLDTSDPHMIDSVLYGDKIDIQDVIDQQLPYFLPKSALIPLGKSMSTDDTSWDESLLFRVSPDARLLASVPITDRANLQVWDAKTQNKIFARKGHNPGISTINDVVFSPDGTSLVSSGCNSDFSCEAFLWDIQSGYPLYSLLNLNPENESIRAGTIVFSPDGKELAAVTSGGITLWDAASGNRLQTIPLEKQGLSTLFTPDGTGILSQDFDGNVRIWDVQSGTSKVALETREPYFGLAFTSDGALLKALNFSGQDGERQIEMTVFDARIGKVIEEMQPIREPTGWSTYTSYSFDADHDLLVETIYFNSNGLLRVYDLKRGNLALELFSYTGLNGIGMHFSQGNYLYMTHWDGERYLLDIRRLYHLLPDGQ